METEKNVAIEAMTNAQLIDGAATVSELFLKRVLEHGNKVALREKDFGPVSYTHLTLPTKRIV